MSKVIALSGWKRSGKDTAAEVLIQNGYTRVAFADVLKDMVAEEYSIPRSHCDDPAFKESPILHLPVIPKDNFTKTIAELMFREFRTKDGAAATDYSYDEDENLVGVFGRQAEKLYWTPRALCILKGSVNRAVRSDYWVSRAIEIAKKVNGNVVITDLRYRSEVDQLRAAFGEQLETVRINRFDECQSKDPSERDLDSATFDVTIENKGTLEQFLGRVALLMLIRVDLGENASRNYKKDLFE
jgi:hypothetical protein